MDHGLEAQSEDGVNGNVLIVPLRTLILEVCELLLVLVLAGLEREGHSQRPIRKNGQQRGR